MPSKALLHSALALAHARRLGELGIVSDAAPRLDWAAVRARKNALIADFAGAVERTTTTSKAFTLLRGAATFVDERTLDVDGRRVVGKRFVIATGSSHVRPPIPGLDEVASLTLTSDDVLDLDAIPSSVAVIGSGPVGVELGQLLARAGAKVHLLGQDGRVAGLPSGPLQDALVAPLARELALHANVKVTRVRRDGDAIALTLENAPPLRVARILLAAGRRPNLDGLALERAGVRVEHGVPVHDERLRTSNPAIFVAGDAAGSPALLHTATIQGRTAGRNAAREEDPQRPELDPALHIVFSDPIVATVGLDPEEAKRAGHAVCVSSRRWSDQGKARIIDETEGLAQLVVDRASRKVLGCQLVGPNADLLIHLVSYALHFGATVDDLVAAHHYHPTLAEMIPSLAQKIVSELDEVECIRGDVAAVAAMQ